MRPYQRASCHLTSTSHCPSGLTVTLLCLVLLLLPPTARALDDGLTDYVTIPAGSYIIDMGVTPQTVANGLKPYGLVYDLIVNRQVTVDWVINPAKTKDGADFTYNAKAYRGAPFVIHAEQVNAAVVATINNWKAQGVVVDGPTTVAISNVPVYDTLTSLARLALDTDNGSITAKYLVNAGIPGSAYTLKLPTELSACDDIFALPHADPTWADHHNLINFVQAGGYVWSACHAVSVLENLDDPGDPDSDPDMNFLSVSGLVPYGSHNDGSPPYTYPAIGDIDPAMQFMSILDAATENGSEQVFLPNAAGWRPATRIYVYDPDQKDIPLKSPGEAVIVAVGRAFGISQNGRVMYEAGHDHSKSTAPENVAAQRAFLNFYLLSGIERRAEPYPTVPATMTEGLMTNLTGTVNAGSGSYTYQWSSSIGGTFGDANSLSTTYISPSIVTNTPALLRLVVTDSCGRRSFRTASVTVEAIPNADLSVTATESQNPVAADASFNYVLSVVNRGPDPATNVVVSDTLPTGVTFTGAAGTGWSCSHSNGVVTCSRSILSTNVGSPSSITITLTSPPNPATLTNHVTVSSLLVDPNPSDNTNAITTFVINGIDLGLTMTAVASGYSGILLPYTFTVTNHTPVGVTNVLIEGTLPTTLDYDSGSGPNWSSYYDTPTRRFTLILPTLAASGTSTVTLNLIPGTNAAGLTVTNTGTVRSSIPDPDPSNNTASQTTAIQAAADLGIQKSSEVDTTPDPDAFTFTIILENLGASVANSITVTDILSYSVSPFPLYFSNAVATVGSYTPIGIQGSNGGSWTISSLAVGDTATLTLYYGGNTTATFTNTATILSAAEYDPDPANNSDTTVADKDYKLIDLGVLMTDSPDPVAGGSNITYTITATNTEPKNDWSGGGKILTVTDPLPPNTTFVSASGTDWTCSYDGPSRTVTCTYTKDINHKQAKSFTLVITAPSTPGYDYQHRRPELRPPQHRRSGRAQRRALRDHNHRRQCGPAVDQERGQSHAAVGQQRRLHGQRRECRHEYRHRGQRARH